MLFILAGRPWRLDWLDKSSESCPGVNELIAVTMVLVGLWSNELWLSGLGWSWLFLRWLGVAFSEKLSSVKGKGFVLIFLTFPWLESDFQILGWWMRLAGAVISAEFYTMWGLDIWREGVLLYAHHTLVSVDEACDGMNNLQALLLVGAALPCFRETRFFWWWWAILPLLALVGQVLRILVLSGLAWGLPDWQGAGHGWVGWFVLMGVFGAGLFILEPLAVKREGL